MSVSPSMLRKAHRASATRTPPVSTVWWNSSAVSMVQCQVSSKAWIWAPEPEPFSSAKMTL